jgi:DNA-binding HxlR family transcriptional regulator
MKKPLAPFCSIARSLEVLGERWTLLILRDAFAGSTRFSQFRANLKIAPDVLSDRLATLVDYGVLERSPYQDPGARARFAYRLTPSGQDLLVALSALQQWGDDHLPREGGPSVLRRVTSSGRAARVGFIDDAGVPVGAGDVAWHWAKPDFRGETAIMKDGIHD